MNQAMANLVTFRVKLNLLPGFVTLLFFCFTWVKCTAPSASKPPETTTQTFLHETDTFKKYWYGGVAEITTYQLVQARYGESRNGKAVLIFVSEPFSKSRQVKLDAPEQTSADATPVLKMNFTKNFITGIYPYSMMLSVFTPIDRREFNHSLKATATVQEWCGQVFAQINYRPENYTWKSFSYFEKEGDEEKSLPHVWLEDELWNLIRLAPDQLPTGEQEVLPGLFYSRLLHTPNEPVRAVLTKTETDSVNQYEIRYPADGRSLQIFYEAAFPHRILRWRETFTERGQPQVTEAVKENSVLLDYWAKNQNQFLYLRDSIGLSPTNF
jgi:hypothetical protein